MQQQTSFRRGLDGHISIFDNQWLDSLQSASALAESDLC